MADIRSAAGDGSEPGVPSQNQPAQELANLIAESTPRSDAKGKGFWRRRRRKTTALPEPAPAPTQPESTQPESAGDAEPEDSKKQVGPDVPESESQGASEPISEHAAATGSAHAREAEAGQAEAGSDEAGELEAASEESTSSEVAAGGSEEDAATADPVGERSVGGDGEQGEDRPRASVGVVYEPDESPDGFPLEYGNIIIGMPKQQSPADESSDAEETKEPDAEEPAPSDGPEKAEPAAAEEPEPAAAQAEPEPEPESEPDRSDQVADEAGKPVAEGEPTAGHELVAESEPVAEGETAVEGEPVVEGEPGDEAPSEVEAGAEGDSQAGEAAQGPVDSDAVGGAAGDGEREAHGGSVGGGEDASDGGQAASAEGSGEGEPEAEGAAPGDGSGVPESTDAAEGADATKGAVGAGSAESAAEADASEAVEPADAEDGAEAGDGAGAAKGAEAAEGADVAGAAEGAEPAESAEAGDGAGAAESAEVAGGVEGVDGLEDGEGVSAEELAGRLAAEQAAMALITALMKLRGALAAGQLPLEVVGADEARRQQKAMLDQLDDYLLPRLVQLEAPVLAVVGGSTGAGKSTLVNTVIGKVVSEPGVLRPTTRSPVLIHHPADADWFVGDRVLPGMARTSAQEPGGTEDPGQLRLVAADTVPRGLAILDAPDIDSVVEANRDLATQLLAAADLWLFVTTAARYSDAVPWDFLQSASDRSTAVAVVLDRAPGETIDDITGHLAQLLLERGLGDSPLFSIQETVVDSNGMLPAETVASIKDWLVDLAADAEARTAVVRRTLQGAVTAMVKKTPPFAAAVRAQAETSIELRSSVESAYDQAVKDVAKACQDGTVLRGEVLARWQAFVGTGELLKGLQSSAGRLRDRLKNSLGNKPAETRDVSDAIRSGLESLLREHGSAAAERAEQAWQATAAGRQLLAAGGDQLGAMSEEFPAAAERTVHDWQTFVLDLVHTEGADKRSAARILEYGLNGLGLSLMVTVFASGAGVPKAADTSVGTGSALVGRRLLEAVFGDKAVQTLVEKAREDLDGKVHALMDAEFARYLAVLDQHPVDAETARQLTEAARAVEDCT